MTTGKTIALTRWTSVGTVIPLLLMQILNGSQLWKILQEMGKTDHLTYFLGNLYTDQEATARTKHEKTDWFQTGKGVCQGCTLCDKVIPLLLMLLI